MDSSFARYNAGFMTEMGHCIKAAHRMGLLRTPAFVAAVEKAVGSAPAAVQAWDQLVLAFTTEENKRLVDPVARFLKHIRNNSFHYGHREKFNVLTSGYHSRFGVEVFPDGSNVSAFASLGSNHEGTRFYFADAAMAGFTEATMNECGVTGPRLGSFSEKLGMSLRYIVEALLEHFEAEAATGGTVPVSAGVGS
jgi:hypothetical protein